MAPAEKTALITGATGFIGGHLARRLAIDGWQTHAVIRAGSNTASLASFLDPAHIHLHDGTMSGMLDIVRAARPVVIFHLASLFLAQHTTADVTSLIRSNVEFGTQLAEAAAVEKVSLFINTGTAWQHFNDEDFNPVNLYAATKQAMSSILRYYAETGAFRVINLELFDTYGPGDARPKLFSALRKAADSRQPLAMSPGDQLVDLVHVDDVVEAYLATAARLRPGGGQTMESFAVSSGAPLRLRELVSLWCKMAGKTVDVLWGARPCRQREVMAPWNGTQLPGWSARKPLEQGLRDMEVSAKGSASHE